MRSLVDNINEFKIINMNILGIIIAMSLVALMVSYLSQWNYKCELIYKCEQRDTE